MEPAISVIMSVYNDAPFVGATIESILAQDFPAFEFLICDDRSTDNSPVIILSYAAKDPRIRLVSADKKGRVPALNALIAQARAPLVALIDSDDLCARQRLLAQHAYMTNHPAAGLLGAHSATIDESGHQVARPVMPRPLDHEAIMKDAGAGILLLHSTMMVRTALLRQIGGYRAPFRTSQDYDLYLRLSEITRLANLPEVLVRYRVHAKQVSSSKLVEQTLAAAVAWQSHRARRAGRSDPVSGLSRLPALDDLDSLFGQSGIAAAARRRIVDRVLYAPGILAGEADAIFQRHVRESKPRPELWRAAARLGLAGHVGPALRAVAGLVGAPR